ncbi:MAG: peptidase [Microcoleaceae cyanobacterium]
MISQKISPFRILVIAGIALALVLGLNHSIAANPELQFADEQTSGFQIHPLPPTLQTGVEDPQQDLESVNSRAESSGQDSFGDDYFDQIEPTEQGYLVWSEFPIRVYIEPMASASDDAWQIQVESAVMEWHRYLPLEIVKSTDRGFDGSATAADIRILPRRPPLEPGNLRASSAQARPRFFQAVTPDGTKYWRHQFEIWITPTRNWKSLAGTVRHEFGHALGIWGHSPSETDVMYFAQVVDPPEISTRDINTLRRIYQQPTQLGLPPKAAARN